MKELPYILRLRNALKPEFRNMPLFQNGSAIITERTNENGAKEILLAYKTDRDQWAVPGGLQELGETFEVVALRELLEETGLRVKPEDLVLIDAVSGETRKNSYPKNGDQVYNNTMLYKTCKFTGDLKSEQSEEPWDFGGGCFEMNKEIKEVQWFSLTALPDNLMDKDLIERYLEKHSKD